MEDKNKLKAAQDVMKLICKTLDKHDWKYKLIDELRLAVSARGEDLPMDLDLHVDQDRFLVMCISHIPFVINEDKRVETAMAVNMVNDQLVHGHFDFDLESGHMFFRMVTSYVGMSLSEEVIAYLLFCACHTIDEYNDKFLMLAKGMISLEQFMTAINK